MKQLPEKWVIKVSYNMKDNPEVAEWRGSFWSGAGYITNTKVWSTSPLDYKEITLEQFKKLVLKESGFVLPDNWHVVVTEENVKVLSKWRGLFSQNLPISIGYIVGRYGLSKSKKHNPGTSRKGFGKEITFEQFKKFVLNIDSADQKEIEKEIIGYKLVKPEYEKAAIEITGFVVGASEPFSKWVEYCRPKGISASRLREAGVLDSWFEPIYEEEFKIGDWITITENDTNNWWIEEFCNNSKTFKIIGEKSSYRDGEYWKVEDPITKQTGGMYLKFRKATKDEILITDLTIEATERYPKGCYVDQRPAYPKAIFTNADQGSIMQIKNTVINVIDEREVINVSVGGIGVYNTENKVWAPIVNSYPDITINEYKAEFRKNYVKFGCATISRCIFQELARSTAIRHIHDFGNKEITAVQIGKGLFTVEQIKEIAEYYKNK